jgi:hypothetical protein
LSQASYCFMSSIRRAFFRRKASTTKRLLARREYECKLTRKLASSVADQIGSAVLIRGSLQRSDVEATTVRFFRAWLTGVLKVSA